MQSTRKVGWYRKPVSKIVFKFTFATCFKVCTCSGFWPYDDRTYTQNLSRYVLYYYRWKNTCVNRYKVSNHQIYCRKNMCEFKNMIEVNLKSKERQLHFHCLFLSTPSFENEKQISFYQLLFIAIKFYIGSP